MTTKTNISGLITTLLSTVCCIVPLMLLLLSIGSSWVANLTALEPYKLYFIGIPIVILASFIAYWKIFLQKQMRIILPSSTSTIQMER